MVRALVSGPDGGDLFMSAPGDRLPVEAGGFVTADGRVDPRGVPFGLVELVVEHGVGAGTVARLEVGRYVFGPGADADVVVPSLADVEVEVRCGGLVFVDDETEPWPIGARRALAGLHVLLRWCAGPAGAPGRPVRGLVLADLLLDRIAGAVAPEAAPAWELGRRALRVTGGQGSGHGGSGDARGIGESLGTGGASRESEPRGGGSESVVGAPGQVVAGEVVALDVAAHPLVTVTGAHRRAFVRGVLGRLLATCGSERVRLTVLAPDADDETRAEWAWTRWLPHAAAGDERVVRVGFDDRSCGRLVADLASARAGLLDVVVVDGGRGGPPRVVRPGLAVIVLDDSGSATAGFTVVADGSRAVVLDAGALRRERQDPSTETDDPTGQPVTIDVDLPTCDWSDRLARTLAAPEREAVVVGRLADLLGVAPDDAAAYEERWARPATTRVPIGWGAGGEAVSVDLRVDGPHALIGGTTGSGKSELLLTLVASLAAANPPEAVSFLLVDYKGGAAFGECARLPHTVGVVTDLDASLTARALASLSAEVRRRERLLAESGVSDVDAYLTTGQGPLARLVIVVDEFATLAAELPDFIDGLVDIARRGRSLGLHLVLATQRPAGAVSADIRANTTLRISLRVAETADSLDVIGVPDAVAIGENEPGRALIRVGQNTPVAVQTARVTLAVHPSVCVPYVFGEPLPEAGERSDLERMAATTNTVADGRGVPRPARPWLPPLPETVGVSELAEAAGVDTAADADVASGTDTTPGGAIARGGIARGRGIAPGADAASGPPWDMDLEADDDHVIPFGLEDRPTEQRRALAQVRLDEGTPLAVVGGARSGRTGALRAVAAAAAARFSVEDLHLYAIDAGARGLGALEDDPHVGAVVFRDEPDRLARLVTRLGDELDRRVQTVALDRRRGPGARPARAARAQWPYIVLLVDRWDLLVDAAEADDDRGILVALERLVTEGGRVGMVVVVTGDRGLLTGRSTTLFPDRLVLRLSDVYDYAALGVNGPAGRGEPGRGWRGIECVETQVCAVEDATGGIPRGHRAATRHGQDPGGPFRIDTLPGIVTREDVLDLTGGGDPMPPGGLVVGVGGDDLGPRWIDADEYGPCALVTGRRRSGRSGVLLTLAESALASDRPWEIVVVLGRRSPLALLPQRIPEVHGPFRDDDEAAALAEAVDGALERGHPVLVLVDDLDLLVEGDLLDELGNLPARLRDTSSLFVGAGEAEEIIGTFRGPAPALRRGRCGVMLSPQSADDGDAFGVRLRRTQIARALGAGGGFLVLDGLAERIQVVRSDFLPDPTV